MARAGGFAHVGKTGNRGRTRARPGPMRHRERKLPTAQGRHDQAALLVGCVGLVVASAAQCDQLVEVEVRAPCERLTT